MLNYTLAENSNPNNLLSFHKANFWRPKQPFVIFPHAFSWRKLLVLSLLIFNFHRFAKSSCVKQPRRGDSNWPFDGKLLFVWDVDN